MTDEFAGPATRMSEADIVTAARAIDCEVAAVKAVIDVESRGGFLADGRPKILFERHLFSRFTDRKFDKPPNDDIANSSPGGYKGGAAEYARLHRAIALDRTAALKAASWGAFQILGSNFAAAGYANVEDFCRAMCQSEGQQLNAFVAFVRSNKLADELQRHDWAGFARGYNGPNYKINHYDDKLADAYRVHSTGGPRTDGGGAGRILRMGDSGDDVKALQHALKITEDGDFGPATRAAVMAFQQANGLLADGVVGPLTRQKLGI
jgi:hypothetical protein